MIDTSLSPSRLAVNAAKRQPITHRNSSFDTFCAMCGTELRSGEACCDFVPGSSFNDKAALAAAESPYLCGDCVVLRDKMFLMNFSKSCITRDGFFGFASNNDRAFFLTTPPEPPFVMIGTDAKQQHLIWRTPVSWSRDLFFVRFGNELLTLRRGLLLEGLAAAQQLGQILDGRAGRFRTTPHPFVAIDRALASPLHGMVRKDAYDAARENGEAREALEVILKMRNGELWGLSSLLYAQAPYTQPEKIL